MLRFSKFIFVLFFSSFAFANTNSPIGLWRTIDDVSGKPKAIVQIWENPDRALFGKIIKIYPRPGHDQNEVCEACEGARHNQRIVGMVFMENLKPSNDANVWSDGKILDPKNGKIYNCNAKLSERGDKLNVRGYIGMPLFGRTQTWMRVDDLQNT